MTCITQQLQELFMEQKFQGKYGTLFNTCLHKETIYKNIHYNIIYSKFGGNLNVY